MAVHMALGRRPEHPESNRAFSFAPRVELPIKTKVWRRYGAVLDQGNVGACTGFAAAHSMNMLPHHSTGEHILNNTDGLLFYSNNTAIDEFAGTYPPDDTGSSGLAACKTLQQFGHITSYEWSFSFDQFLQALMHGPQLVGTWWRDGMFYPSASGLVVPSGAMAGGHEYVAQGIYSLSQRILVFQNSWSDLWGVKGRFFMTFNDFASLLAADGDAVLPRV